MDKHIYNKNVYIQLLITYNPKYQKYDNGFNWNGFITLMQLSTIPSVSRPLNHDWRTLFLLTWKRLYLNDPPSGKQ